MVKKAARQQTRDSVAEEKKPNPKVKLVFVGPCTTTDKKLGGMFVPITDEQLQDRRLPEALPPERIYGGKVPKQVGRPGTIYEFDCDPEKETTIFGNTGRYVGFLENDPRVVQWQANHDAFFAAEELKRQEKKGKKQESDPTAACSAQGGVQQDGRPPAGGVPGPDCRLHHRPGEQR